LALFAPVRSNCSAPSELLVTQVVADRGLIFVGCLVALLASACSDKECDADKSLAEICADGHCPRDFNDAVAKGLSCDVSFYQVWRDGENRAVGVASGFGGGIYYFEGQQLVGFETYTDLLDANDSCPRSYAVGRRTLVTIRDAAGSVASCSLCPDYVTDDLPRCTEAELE